MLTILLSPSKTMDFKRPCVVKNNTIPSFINESQQLINLLKELDKDELIRLMKVSPSIANENFIRFRKWCFPFPEDQARPAVMAFKGDVYEGLKAEKFTASDLEFAMRHLRIISALYGLLRPLDLIMPYRLEMSVRLANSNGRTLYKYWGDKITDEVNKLMKENGSAFLVNLSSSEYFKSINLKKINRPVITPVFMEKNGNGYETIGIHSKRARGMMSRFLIMNRIRESEEIKEFCDENYKFNKGLSEENNWIFTR